MEWLRQYKKDTKIYKIFAKLTWLDSLPMFLSLCVVAAAILTTGENHLFIPAILGAVAGSLIEKDNNFIQLLFNYVKGIVSFTFTFWLMSSVVNDWGLFILVVTISSFLWIYIGTVSKTINALAIANINVSFDFTIIYTPGQSFDAYLYMASIFFAATILYCILSLLTYILLPSRNLMIKMSNSLEDLANLFDQNSKLYDVDDLPIDEQTKLNYNNALHTVKGSLEQTQISLNNQIVGFNKKSSYKMLRYYKMIEEIISLMDAAPSDHENLKRKLSHSDILFRMQTCLELFATEIRDVANSLDRKERVTYNPRLTIALDNLELAIDRVQGKFKTELLITIKSLRKVQLLIRSEIIRDNNLVRKEINSFIDDVKKKDNINYRSYNKISIWQQIKYTINNLILNFNKESSDFRYAVRISIALFLATNLYYITNASFTFWVSTAAFLILQPNFTLTKYRVKGRVFGTIFGASLAFVYLLGFNMFWLTIFSVIFIALHHVLRKNYGFSTFAFTFGVLAAIEVSTLNLDPTQFMLRILANIVGAIIASVLMVIIWPDWKFLNIKSNIKNALDSSQELYTKVAKSFSDPTIEKTEITNDFLIAKTYNSRFTTLVMSLRKEMDIFHDFIDPCIKFMYLNDSMLKHLTIIIPLIEEHRNQTDVLDPQIIQDLYETAKCLANIQNLSQVEYINKLDNLVQKYREISQISETETSLYYQQLENLAIQVKQSSEFNEQTQIEEQEIFEEKQQHLDKIISSQNNNFMEQKMLVLLNLLVQYQIAYQEVYELEDKSSVSNKGVLSFFIGKRLTNLLMNVKRSMN